MRWRTAYPVMLAMTLLLGACHKDELDVAQLNTNPFDADYAGPPIFTLEGTWLLTTSTGPVTFTEQVIGFRVDESSFLSPASYGVEVRDLLDSSVEQAVPGDGPGRWQYRRVPVPGQEVCLELRLWNDFSTARAETICATL